MSREHLDRIDSAYDDRESAQDWTDPITHQGQWFKDIHGRTLLMRGVNLSGTSKLPIVNATSFWDHRNVSFVDRPFPLKEADEHFRRLNAWGLTLIRLLVTWESLEHAGPGQYDEDYIDYLRDLIALMPKYGLKCVIDPHQDTWSRFSGGSGAPGWTFEVAGLNIKHFKETGAAYVHNITTTENNAPPPMIWPTNYSKLASSTMFTLFFAGDTFAPHATYQDQSIQQILNRSFIDTYGHLARRLVDLEAVLGFEFMNEPHPGYIGLDHLNTFDPKQNLIYGDSPTPLQSFALGDGIPQQVDVYVKSWPYPTKRSSDRLMNPDRKSAWLEGCVWRAHGVWDDPTGDGQPVLLDTHYFSRHPRTGQKVSFYDDFYLPLVNRFAKTIQSVKENWYCLVEPLPNERAPVYKKNDHHQNIVYAPHWYDLDCLFHKKFNQNITHDVQCLYRGGNVIQATYFGRNGAKRNYHGQIKNIKQDGLRDVGEKPCILGEVGIPMDLNQRSAFKNGNYSSHIVFLDAVMYALETNLMNFTLWNYDIHNDHVHGDHWNGEDFSIYCPKETINISSEQCSIDTETKMSDPYLYKGGRVLEAILRPYASKIAGIPISSEFDLDRLHYQFVFKPFKLNPNLNEKDMQELDPLSTTTEIFVPYFHFGGKPLAISASLGECDYDQNKQTLYHSYNHISVSDSTLIHITLGVHNHTKSGQSCIII